MLVERLREVSALRGFTRINAPDELGSGGGKIVPLAREAPRWLPCSEVRGEGIFIRFPEENGARMGGALSRHRRRPRPARGTPRVASSAAASTADEGWPGERYVLLHSFAHALIRELALECGYTASSIRERLYAISGGEEEPMAGVLLYTAAPDSEGTLGGLVSLGEPEQLGPLLRQALDRAQLCSSDPLCSEHDPRSDSSVHARRLPRLPVRLGDLVRARQPVPRPRHAGPHARRPRRRPRRRLLPVGVNIDDAVATVLERLSDAQVRCARRRLRTARSPDGGIAHVSRRRAARRRRGDHLSHRGLARVPRA